MERAIPKAKQAEEVQFVKRQLDALKSQKLKLPDTYSPPDSKRARRAPIANIPLCPPPEPTTSKEASSSAAAPVTLTITSAKPPLSFTLEKVEVTSTIGALKAALVESAASSSSSAPPPDAQRWVLGGKVLADGKLLREYDLPAASPIKVNLFVKAGWTPSAAVATPSTSSSEKDSTSATPKKDAAPAGGLSLGTLPVPTLQLEPGTPTGAEHPAAVAGLVIDTANVGPAHPPNKVEAPVFTDAVADPLLWLDIHAVLTARLGEGSEAARKVFEAWFGASKAWLSPSQIAAVRDRVGISGMSGN